MADRSAFRFEQIVGRILTANGYVVEPSLGFRFDLVARRGDAILAVEIKYYRSAVAQISLLEAASSQLLAAARPAQVNGALLIISAALPVSLWPKLEERLGVEILDRDALIELTAAAPELLDELREVLEGNILSALTKEPRGFQHRAARPPLPQESAPPTTRGADLCAQLRALATGRTTWQAHEALCREILMYLFDADLHGWHDQLRTDDGFNRYDCVCRIKSDKAFWQFLADNLNSRYVIFEFKNYARTIKQGQVLTTEKYLFERGLRKTAIILTRRGASAGALAIAQGAMREHGKLILMLDDDALCEMLQMRDNGEDASDFVFDGADRFLLTLPR